MAPGGGNSQDRRAQFFAAIKNQKLDSVRWALTHGGQNPGTRDDDGYTAIMLATIANKPKVLQLLLDICRRSRELELIDLVDGEGEEKTALHMAAENGFKDCVKELLYAGAKPGLKDEDGKTAEMLAREAGHVALADYIKRGGDDESSDDDDGGAADEGEDGEETSTQRNRRKKKELAAKENRGAKTAAKDADAAKEEEAAAAAAAAAAGPVTPTWPEVAKALETGAKELILHRPDNREGLPAGEVLDPALWGCTSLNLLNVTIAPKAAGGDAPLTKLPDSLRRLTGLRTLILARNGLEALPAALCALTGLKVLDVSFNCLEALPEGFGALTALETLSLDGNCVKSLAPLAPLTNLVTLNVDGNMVTSLDELDLSSKARLATLSARGNAIQEIPAEVEKCVLLQSVYLKGNAIADVAYELCLLKKLKDLELEENPLSDAKIKKMLQKPQSFVKDLMPYLKKQGKSAPKKGGKGGKKKQESESESEDEAPAAPAAPAPAPAAAAPPPAAKKEEPAAAAKQDDDDGPRKGESKKQKLEREKAERKAAEERMKQMQREALEKSKAEEERLRAAAESSSAAADDDDDDDEEAILARRRKAKPTFAYSLDPAERERLEKEEAAREAERRRQREAEEQRLAQLKLEEQEKAEAKLRASQAQKETQLTVITWAYTAGTLNKVMGAPGSAPPKKPQGGKGGAPMAGILQIEVEIPQMICGRIIGKAGATIKEITARSSARVNIESGSNGNSVLSVSGRPEAVESARMLINNALAAPRKP